MNIDQISYEAYIAAQNEKDAEPCCEICSAPLTDGDEQGTICEVCYNLVQIDLETVWF